MTNRVAIGNVGGVYKLAVSKAGVDVLSAGAGDLTLDSEKTHLRSVQVGTFTIPSGSIDASVSVSGLSGTDTFGARVGLLAASAVEQSNLAEIMEKITVSSSAVYAKRLATAGSDTIFEYHVLAF